MAMACALLPGLALAADREDTGWPRVIKTSRDHTIVVYEPRVTSFKGRELSANAATAIQPPGDGEPTFGAIWFDAILKTDSDGKSVDIEEMEVTESKFPENTPQLEETIAAIVERELPKTNRPWPLDRIYAGLEAEKNETATAAKLRNDAPEILVSTEPAVLLVYQGEPQARPVSGSDLSRIVNTSQLVVYDGGGKRYYLAYGDYWYQSKDPMGPWESIVNPPSNVLALKPEDSNAPGRDEGPRMESAPEVLTSAKPAELIVFDGSVQFEPVPSTDLLYVTNSDKDVLKDVESQKYYVLLSGRWYSSTTLNGPWTFVPSDKLPQDFANIPANSDLAHLRSSVAGTPEAEDAVLSARVPKIEAVDRSEKPDLTVTYDGQPEFRRIKGTNIAYAVNTSASVFRQEDRYYACDDGVWYVSDEPDGPWVVSDTRPEGLEELPAENPNYHTKYVYIYDSTPDVVYVGYTPGYWGCYPYWGSVVYGTGWYYHPWAGYAYYPYPATWGFGITYWGGWGFGFYASFGYPYYGYGYPYYGYGGYPAYCGGYYGPGGYYPGYYPNYGTSRTRTTVGDRQFAGYPNSKTTALRGSAGGAMGTNSVDRTRVGSSTMGKTTVDRTRTGKNTIDRNIAGTLNRTRDGRALTSGKSRYRTAPESMTQRSYGTRERSSLSDRGIRSMRGGSSGSGRALRDNFYPRGNPSGTRSRSEMYRTPRVNGRSYGDGRVLRGSGREWSGGRSGSNRGGSVYRERSGSGGRSGGWSSGRSGMGGGSRSGGGGRSGGSSGRSRGR